MVESLCPSKCLFALISYDIMAKFHFFIPSRRELSTDQVDKPVNMGALTKWVGHIPTDVREEMRKIAPMLANLGYDPDAYPPNYGTPDRTVVDNSLKVGIPLNESVGIVNQVS